MKINSAQLIQSIVIVGLFIGVALVPVTGSVVTYHTNDTSLISIKSATTVASMKLAELNTNQYSLADYQILFDENSMILCYAFNLYPIGYIIISAYPTLPPVLAYSLTGSFSTEGTVLTEIIKADITLRLHHLEQIPTHYFETYQNMWNTYLLDDLTMHENRLFQQWPSQGTTRSSGWLDTKWHQNAPFNNMAPIDQNSGGRSVAGCPAVTMAQICNYHQTINGIVFNDTDDYYHSYNGNNYWIDTDYILYDFPSFPQLNTYLDDLVLHYQQGSDLTDDDKAVLTFACGIAATQVYHPSGSGTFGVSQAYDAYQRFNFEDVELLDENDPDVYERIQDNIKDGLPVHLAVVNEGWTVGHNLVIDGYNTDGYYHLNFGWGGSYDGWYNIPEELPFDLTVLEGVVVDITDDNAISNLQGNGNLYWPNIRPGATITGSIQIQNSGDPGSSIDWEIVSWPEWGIWTFTPDAGNDLTPGASPLTIDISLEVPNEKNMDFNGCIRINNIDNSSDYCLIHVLLSTPQTYTYQSLILQFLQKHPHLFPILHTILNQYI